MKDCLPIFDDPLFQWLIDVFQELEVFLCKLIVLIYELIWKLLLVWLGSVNLKNNEWLNMVDLCEFAEMIKYPILRWGVYGAG